MWVAYHAPGCGKQQKSQLNAYLSRLANKQPTNDDKSRPAFLSRYQLLQPWCGTHSSGIVILSPSQQPTKCPRWLLVAHHLVAPVQIADTE